MKQKMAIVTGTSRGLGYHIAQGLVEKGWQVFGFARSSSTIIADNYTHIPFDLADLPLVESYFEGEFKKILDGYQGLEIALVNNAGQLEPVIGLGGINLRDLCDAFQLNSILPIWLMGFCLRTWPDLPLSIVNISSGAAVKPYAGWGVYCSSKAALRMAGQVLVKDEETSQRPVRVLSFEPGVLDTKMQEQVRSADPKEFPQLERFLKMHENGQLLDPKLPAAELVDYLQKSFQATQFSEKRFGDPS